MHLLTQSALLQALGWSLFNSLWQMGLLWLLYQLFILIFSKSPARTRHGLALLLILAGTGWCALSFITAWLITPGSTGVAGAFPIQSIRSFIASAIPYGSTLYLLILTALMTRYFYFYFISSRLARQGLSRIAPEYRVFVSQTARQLGIRQKVAVWLSAKIDVPVTLGIMKPVILLPLTLCNSLTTAQVEAILIHELAHIRRNDFLLNLVVTLLEGLFFFNPFVRRLIAYLKKEREHCCDDQVLQFHYDPHSYVSALLSVAGSNRPAALAMAATGDSNNRLLLQRAKRILLQQRTAERPGLRPFALLFLVLLLTGVTLSRPTRPPAPPPPPLSRPVAATPVAAELKLTYSGPGPTHTGLGPTHPVYNHTATIPESQPQKPAPAAPSPTASATASPNRHPVEQRRLLLINTVADGDMPPQAELVAIIRNPDRSFSISQSGTEVPDQAREKGQPFVPKASFSFHSIEEDTLRPEEKLARLQIDAQREIALNMQKLQLDLMAQLEIVKQRQRDLAANYAEDNQENLKQQRALIEQQIQLQRAYIQKLDQLQKQLKKVRRLTIVYI